VRASSSHTSVRPFTSSYTRPPVVHTPYRPHLESIVRLSYRAIRGSEAPFPVMGEPISMEGAQCASAQRARRSTGVSGESASIARDGQDNILLLDTSRVDKLVKAQHEDPDLQRIIQYLEKHSTPATLSSIQVTNLINEAKNYILVPQPRNLPAALYYMPSKPRRGLGSLVPCVPRLVVPPPFRKTLLQMFHDSPFGGHFGIKRTLRKLAVSYFWPTMHQEVSEYVTSCASCAREKI
jgi:hypothetical protein